MRQNAEILRSQKQLSEIWAHVKNACVYKARKQSEDLVEELQKKLEENKGEDRELLEALAHACHAAGYTTSMNVRNYEASCAIFYYNKMLDISHRLNNNVLLVIALTYKRDSYRRKGNIEEAMECLRQAYEHRPQKDAAALGNCAQLLAYLFSGG